MKTPHKITLIFIFLWLVTLATASVILKGNNKRIQSLEQANGMLTNEVTAYKTVNGKLLSQNQAAELREKEFRQALPELADALTKQMDIKLRNFRAGVLADFIARGSGNSQISRIDTLLLHDTISTSSFEPFALTFYDGYLSFKSDVYSELNAPSEYVYGDTIKFSFNMQRPKRFHQKQLFVSGSLANPNAKILNSKGVLINEFKQKRFGIGPAVGYGVVFGSNNELHHGYFIGATLNWNVIRF